MMARICGLRHVSTVVVVSYCGARHITAFCMLCPAMCDSPACCCEMNETKRLLSSVTRPRLAHATDARRAATGTTWNVTVPSSDTIGPSIFVVPIETTGGKLRQVSRGTHRRKYNESGRLLSGFGFAFACCSCCYTILDSHRRQGGQPPLRGLAAPPPDNMRTVMRIKHLRLAAQNRSHSYGRARCRCIRSYAQACPWTNLSEA